MSSVTTSPSFDHSSIDVRNINTRRAHMKEFFLHLGLWDEEKVKAFRDYGRDHTCEMLYTQGCDQVNPVYLEIAADYVAWSKVLEDGNMLGQGHDWPWFVHGGVRKSDVTTNGISRYYQKWQQRHIPDKIEQMMATGQVLYLCKVSSLVHYMPEDTHIECIFGGVSTRFPADRIRALDEKQLRSYILGVVDGAFPLCAKAYAADEILLLARYKIIGGDSGN